MSSWSHGISLRLGLTGLAAQPSAVCVQKGQVGGWQYAGQEPWQVIKHKLWRESSPESLVRKDTPGTAAQQQRGQGTSWWQNPHPRGFLVIGPIIGKLPGVKSGGQKTTWRFWPETKKNFLTP